MAATVTPPASPAAPRNPGDRCGSDAARDVADPLLRRKEQAENFPVALRVLPRDVRADLRAIYDIVRVIDDLGDEAAGDRLALLDEVAADLHRAWAGEEPRLRVVRNLRPAIARRGLPEEQFQRLVEANRRDQQVLAYQSYDQLIGYCELSATPIGRLVLAVFGAGSPRAAQLSDRICAALQLLEHWQDVGEDRARGRVYLPADELAAFGVSPSDLDAASAPPQLRRLVEFETARAVELLESGRPLVAELHGWARVAVAGYVAGGLAAAAALRRADFDVLGASPRRRRRDVALHGVMTLVGASAASAASAARPPISWLGRRTR